MKRDATSTHLRANLRRELRAYALERMPRAARIFARDLRRRGKIRRIHDLAALDVALREAYEAFQRSEEEGRRVLDGIAFVVDEPRPPDPASDDYRDHELALYERLTGKPYTIYGYKGKQVRDNIHAYDLVTAFWHFFQNPIAGEVYNMGGSRHSNCSMLEAIAYTEELTGKRLNYTMSDDARSGDHIWWISDVRKFQRDFPAWKYEYDIKGILGEIVDALAERLQPS